MQGPFRYFRCMAHCVILSFFSAVLRFRYSVFSMYGYLPADMSLIIQTIPRHASVLSERIMVDPGLSVLLWIFKEQDLR